jgi:transcriptional regulator with XRE-family HTH domain
MIVDPHRLFVFPNRIRELRTQHGFPKLLAFATALPEIPYIRLSKIERGEVVARADEIVRIAALLQVEPREMLIDVDDPDFDIDSWSKPFQDGRSANEGEEEFAVLLAAATRARRARTADLTIAAIEREYKIPPVILSRIENAVKTFDRWNDVTVRGICQLFGVHDAPALREEIDKQYRQGLLDDYLRGIAEPATRLQKTRKLVADLRQELDTTAHPRPGERSVPNIVLHATRPRRRAETSETVTGEREQVRLLSVVGAPLHNGLIAPTKTGLRVEAPRSAGPRAFGLRICRPTLGPGLPGNAILVADPDVFPTSGGLAAVREGENFRVLAITFDLSGAMIGHSINPSMEVPLDPVSPSDLAAVISASFT